MVIEGPYSPGQDEFNVVSIGGGTRKPGDRIVLRYGDGGLGCPLEYKGGELGSDFDVIGRVQ